MAYNNTIDLDPQYLELIKYLNVENETVLNPSSKIKCSLNELFLKQVPQEIEDPNARKHPPLYKQAALCSLFVLGTILFRNQQPLGVALSENVSLTLKNIIRTAEQYFENLKERKNDIGQKTNSLKYIKYFKYGGLAATIISLYAVDLLTEEYNEKNPQLAQMMMGISLKVLDRELNLFLKGPKIKGPGKKKIKQGRSMNLKVAFCTAFLVGGIFTSYLKGSPILVDGCVGAAALSFKYIAKEINWKKVGSLLTLGTLGGYLGDYLVYNLHSKKWLNLSETLGESNLGPIGLTLSLKTAQRSILQWQVGSDEEDEEAHNQIESDSAAPIWKQACATTTLILCGFAMIYFSQNPQPSQTLLNNALTQTSSRMGVNMVQLLPHSEKIALLASMILLGVQTAVTPIKEHLPLLALTTLVMLAIFGARMSDKLIKNYQLGRQFSRE